MTNNPRHIAAAILTDWTRSRGKIDEIRDRYFGKSELEERDRALVTEIVYGVTRRENELKDELAQRVHAPLDRLQKGLLPVLLVALYQIRHLDRVPEHAVVNEAVDDARRVAGDKAAGLVNAVLRSVQRQPQQRPVDAFNQPKTPLNRWRNHWVQQWDEDKAASLIDFFKNIPPVGLRRNLLKTESDEQWHEILSNEGVNFTALPAWPGYVYARDVNPAELPSFVAGITTVQDPGASIAVRALDPQPGERILDLAAAPGGKTALIWERMGGKGELIALDKSMKRNKRTRETLERLGHTQVQVLSEDILSFEGGIFDRVLIDVPCSGTGVAHRRADLLIRRMPLQVEQLAKVQRQLLRKAAKHVKQGGVLVYSTCSLEPMENETRVTMFEKRFSGEFEREALPDEIPETMRLDSGIAATWPPRDGVDGAFVTRWRHVQ